MNKKLIATMAATTLGGVSLLLEDQVVKADDTSSSNQTATANTTTHTVQLGDTLTRIAATYHTTVADLVSTNGISNPNLIIVGQQLTISAASTQPTTPAATAQPAVTQSSVYTVKAGDTVSSIANAHGVSIADIQAWNNLQNINFILVNQQLTIKGATTQVASQPTATQTTNRPTTQTAPVAQTATVQPAATQATPTTVASTGTYVVKAGDTLAKIATQHGTTVSALQALNQLANVNTIFVNQTLSVTGTAQPTAPTQTQPAVTPAATEQPTATPTATEQPTATPATTQSTAPATSTTQPAQATTTTSTTGVHVVKAGETIAKIASIYGVSIEQIKQLNNLTNINTIFVNQKIVVTGTAATNQTTQSTQTATTTTPASTNTTTQTPVNTNTTTTNTATTPVVSADASLKALNELRASKGLNPVTWDASLAASATARAMKIVAAGYTIPNDHWSSVGEVLAFYYSPGVDVINAWYHELNMISATGTGHRDWELNPNTTRVGFGYAGKAIVGHAR